MDSYEECSLAEPYDFSMSVHEDVDTFMNLHEFAGVHEIDGRKVPCIVTSRAAKGSDHEGAFTRSNILLIRASYVKKAEPGMTLRLNGVTYQIGDARLLQGELWRIELGVYDG